MISMHNWKGGVKTMKKSHDTKQLILFFIITLAWTWGFGFVPVFMGTEGTPSGTFLFYFGGGAPSVTALFIVFFTLISIAATWVGVCIFACEMPEMNYVHAIVQNPFNLFWVLFISVISGPLNEEFGI